MALIPFTKVQSVGNDFVLVNLEDVDAGMLPEIAIATSDRRTAVGSDGLLAVGMVGSHLVLRMFNTDGTEDFCGNGIRCAALFAYRHGWIGNQVEICHLGKAVRAEVQGDGRVRSFFDPADYAPSAVPTSLDGELFWEEVEVEGEKLILSAVTTGSTHTVIFSERLPGDEEFLRFGPAIEHLDIFPERTSVIWAEVRPPVSGVRPSEQQSGGPECRMPNAECQIPEGHLSIRIWERGVGETLGCGTGSAAAAAVYLRAIHEGKILAGSTPSEIYVKNPGGTVHISMNGPNAPIISSAVAELLYTAKAQV